MLDDDTTKFVSNLYRYLSDKDYIRGLLVKKHTSNFNSQGDFSFVNTVQSWREYLDQDQRKSDEYNFLKCVNKTTEDIVNVSKTWEIAIAKCVERNDRVYIYLDRPIAVSVGLPNAVLNNLNLLSLMVNQVTSTVKLDSKCTDLSITTLRAKYLTGVINNLCLVHSINPDLTVTSKSGSSGKDIFVGAVLNSKSGVKESEISAANFIRLRQDELTLIAQHKYGVRVSVDEKWKEFIAHLGESAVAFELLQTKSSSPVKILFNSSGGSSKGASFILYNCARLETLLRTFNEKVSEGSYPPLPEQEQIDISLLNNEDEWCLIFNYIMGLPALLKNSVEVGNEKYEFRPHLICNYLSGMVKIFSQYYRRERILTEPRKHLLPVIFARIFMITVLNDTLKNCLRILNIKSVSQM